MPDRQPGGWSTPDDIARARADRDAVPAGVVAAFLAAANDAYGLDLDDYDARAILAATLPVHERLVRERLAADAEAAVERAQGLAAAWRRVGKNGAADELDNALDRPEATP